MGTPQGGVISPLLCNLVLNKLRSVKKDHQSYIEVVRYADDCVIFIKGDFNYWKNHVIGILASIGLELNHNKSEIFDFKGSMFKYKSLGYDV
jgi:RNA-directed DNA polymerase